MQKFFWQIFLLCTILCLQIFAASDSAHAMEMKYTSYLQENNLSWSIAGDLQGKNPNILSELIWRDLKISGLQIELVHDFSEKFFLQSKVGGARIFDGINQDSDYAGNGRTQEFSRSLNQTGGDYLLNGSAGLGMRILKNRWLELAGLGGYGVWVQKLRMINGEQIIPTVGIFSGLDSTYKMDWAGPWLGMKSLLKLNPFFLVEGALAYQAVSYDGVGNWNLRSDLVHPVSFIHHTSGIGKLASLALKYQADSAWAIILGGELNKWVMAPGYDQIFFTNDTSEITRLNQLQSKYVSLNLTIDYTW